MSTFGELSLIISFFYIHSFIIECTREGECAKCTMYEECQQAKARNRRCYWNLSFSGPASCKEDWWELIWWWQKEDWDCQQFVKKFTFSMLLGLIYVLHTNGDCQNVVFVFYQFVFGSFVYLFFFSNFRFMWDRIKDNLFFI